MTTYMIPLVLLILYNGSNWSRSIPCLIVALITYAQYQVYPTDLYLDLQDAFGYYGYTAIIPLLCIIPLSILIKHRSIDGSLSTCLMSLYTLWISVIIALGWLEGIGFNTEPALEQTKVIIYAVELMLMFSTKLTHQISGGIEAIDGSIRRYATGRSSPASNRANHNRSHSAQDHLGRSH